MAERIAFDRTLYSPEAVEAAAAAYADHAQIEVTATAESTVAVIDADPADLHTVTHAFCNHVLHETITRQRQAALEEAP